MRRLRSPKVYAAQPTQSLVTELKALAETGPRGSVWADEARRLMLLAARTIAAADVALMENYRATR